MSCLCYCIGPHPGLKFPGTLRGVGGRPVYRVAHRRLSAAVSQINPADLTPDLPRIRAYERVVVDRILDKGIVVDAWVKVALVGIELLSVEARVVIASVETY